MELFKFIEFSYIIIGSILFYLIFIKKEINFITIVAVMTILLALATIIILIKGPNHSYETRRFPQPSYLNKSH